MSKTDLPGTFEGFVLLAVVRLGCIREIEHRTAREVSLGAVYATLEPLEEQGLREVGPQREASEDLRGLTRQVHEMRGLEREFVDRRPAQVARRTTARARRVACPILRPGPSR